MRERISASLRDAIESEDEPRVAMLRLILAAIRDRENQLAESDGDSTLSEEEIRDLLKTMVRQRRESVRSYEESGRLELAQEEQAEIAILKEFLPKPLSPKEVEKAVARAISETGASSIRDMGKVMAALKAHHAGRIDFSTVGQQVKDRLG